MSCNLGNIGEVLAKRYEVCIYRSDERSLITERLVFYLSGYNSQVMEEIQEADWGWFVARWWVHWPSRKLDDYSASETLFALLCFIVIKFSVMITLANQKLELLWNEFNQTKLVGLYCVRIQTHIKGKLNMFRDTGISWCAWRSILLRRCSDVAYRDLICEILANKVFLCMKKVWGFRKYRFRMWYELKLMLSNSTVDDNAECSHAS